MKNKISILFFFFAMVVAVQAQNQALSFDGSTSYVSLPDLGLNVTNTVTIEANIYSNGIQNSWTGIVVFSGFRSGLIFRSGNELGYMWEDANGNRYGWSSGIVVPEKKWVHVALVITPTQATVYMDGTKATQVKNNVASTLGASRIGADGTATNRRFNGQMTDIRIWNSSRTEAQITTNICSVPSPLTEPTLKAYYPCTPANGTVLTDLIAGKNGTITSGKYIVSNNESCLAPKTFISDFSSDITETWVGNPVHFTDKSVSSSDTQIKNWNWTFAGGTPATSTDKNPTVVYNKGGLYDATLTIDTGSVSKSSITQKIRVYPAPILDRTSWSVSSVSAEQASNLATASIDDNSSTFWHSQWSPTSVPMPHYVVYDMHMFADIYGIGYLPRQDGIDNGKITSYAVYVSNDGVNWGTAVKTGTIDYSADSKLKVLEFATKASGRYIKLWCDKSLTSNQFASCAELYAYGNYTNAISYANDSIELSTMLSDLKPVYNAPSWTDQRTTPNGPIMGNGDMQVILLGDVNKQKFHISSSEMWTDKGGTYTTSGFRMIPTGGLDIYPVTNTSTATFRQEMDFQKANITAVSQSNFKTETFVSSTDNVMVTRLWTDGSVAIPMKVDLWCKSDAVDLPSTAGLDTDKGILWATRSGNSTVTASWTPRWTTRNALAATIQGATCVYTTDNLGKSTASFTLQPGTVVEIHTVLKGKKNATTHLQDAIKRVSELNSDTIALLKQKHQQWWNNFWFHKSWVQTNDMVLNKFYYGALYQFGCINRKEFLPAAQHPFCISDDAAWQGDYHMNQEFMGQNCGFFSANRPELSDGAYQILLDYMPTGRDIAANKMQTIHPSFKPCKGICYNVGLGPWGINTDNFFGNQVSNASWAGSMITWNYYYNRDTTWLRTKGYEYIRALADFWVSHLGAKVNGKYVDWGAGQEGYYGKNPCTDLGLIRFVMKSAIACSKDLNIDADQRPIWQDIIDNLSDYPTYVWKGKRIFQSYDGWNTYDDRGGYSCLEQIWPGEAINMSSPQELKQIAYNTLDISDYWIGPKMAIYGARTGYPIEKNMYQLKTELINRTPGQWEGLRQNGTIGGLRVNGEFMEFIHSSFLQSQEDFIRIFPNWYKNKPAKFHGLKAKGAFIVSAQQNGSAEVEDLTITSEKGGVCALLNPWPGKTFDVTETLNGVKTVIPATIQDDIYRFPTKMGATYTFDIRTGFSSVVYKPATFKVYPNPATTKLTVELSQTETDGNSSVRLVDIFGKEVERKLMSKNANSLTFDVSLLPSGVYIVTYKGTSSKIVLNPKGNS